MDWLEGTRIKLGPRTDRPSLPEDRRAEIPRFRPPHRQVVGQPQQALPYRHQTDPGSHFRHTSLEDERGSEGLRDDVLLRGPLRAIPRNRREDLL